MNRINPLPYQKEHSDNLFTSTDLPLQLKEKEVFCWSTTRAHRIRSVRLDTEKELKRKGNGSFSEVVRGHDEYVLVCWLDNSSVELASTYVGGGNVT